MCYQGIITSLSIDVLHLLLVAMWMVVTKGYNPMWKEAMGIKFFQEYWEVTVKEVEALEQIDAWEMGDHEPGMNVLHSILTFKWKQFPGGLIKKCKARLYARRDMEIEGG